MYEQSRTTSSYTRKGGVMNPQLSSLPYSRRGLQALQEALALHREMYVWVNPVTNQIDIKDLEKPLRPTLVSRHDD